MKFYLYGICEFCGDPNPADIVQKKKGRRVVTEINSSCKKDLCRQAQLGASMERLRKALRLIP